VKETRVAAPGEVAPGRPRLVVVDGARLVLIRVGEGIHALDETCAHQASRKERTPT
jgi:nitrite reductase/ring-hydroxylating ferredoxin subunit